MVKKVRPADSSHSLRGSTATPALVMRQTAIATAELEQQTKTLEEAWARLAHTSEALERSAKSLDGGMQESRHKLPAGDVPASSDDADALFNHRDIRAPSSSPPPPASVQRQPHPSHSSYSPPSIPPPPRLTFMTMPYGQSIAAPAAPAAAVKPNQLQDFVYPLGQNTYQHPVDPALRVSPSLPIRFPASSLARGEKDHAGFYAPEHDSEGPSLFEKYEEEVQRGSGYPNNSIKAESLDEPMNTSLPKYPWHELDNFLTKYGAKYPETSRSRVEGNGKSLITKGLSEELREKVDNTLKSPEAYTQPFCDFLTENPTVWHAVSYFEGKLQKAGFQKLSERQTWNDQLVAGGKYYTTRNGSSLVAFTVGAKYKSGNGVAIVAGHVDALTARLKPVSNKKTSAGYVQLGVAPYAGALNSTWWDRDLGIGGRVVVKDPKTGKISTKLVKLGWPIARIPTLAPHFGIGMTGQENKETQMVPIIGLDNNSSSSLEEFANHTLGSAGSFAATQPPKLVRAIAGELSITDFSSIINWELELYDTQPAQTGGLEKEFIFGGRIDDKVCSWAAVEGLLASAASPPEDDGIIKLVAVFDDEEIGSLLRQGARGNFLPTVIERITESFASSSGTANLLAQTYANSFLISADVTHAVNPNFLGSYLDNHAPRLNVGLSVSADSNGHMTTDSVSTALLTRVAEKTDNKLQLFMIRNDSRSGGTVGPMLSSATGIRAIDAGIPQLSMHSIRATIGNLDPGLGVKIFAGFFDTFEAVDAEFE